MQKLHFATSIKAPKEQVWHAMLDDQTYRDWTQAFSPGSYYKGDWSQGSKILFLGPDPQTGEEGGMVSRVVENKPYAYISIEHLGFIKDGKEDTTSEEVKKWTPAFENYTFLEYNGITELQIDMDSEDSQVETFNQMWSAALLRLKEIAENPAKTR